MTYPIHTIAEHDTTFLQDTYEGVKTYHWYSISAANNPNHEIQPRFLNVDNAKSYILNTLKGIPNRIGEVVNIAYYTAILDNNVAAAQKAIADAKQRDLILAAQQIEAKAQMLNSPTATFTRYDVPVIVAENVKSHLAAEVKKEAVQVTNDINAYNTAVATQTQTQYNTLANKTATTKPIIDTSETATTARTTTTTIKDNKGMDSILIIALVIGLGILIFGG